MRRTVFVLFLAVQAVSISAGDLMLKAHTGRHTRTWDFSYPAGGPVRSFGVEHEIDPMLGLTLELGSPGHHAYLSAEIGEVKGSGHFFDVAGSGRTDIANTAPDSIWQQLELGGRQRVMRGLTGGIGIRASSLETTEPLLMNASGAPVLTRGDYSSFQLQLLMSLKAELDLKLAAVFVEGQYYPAVYQRDRYAAHAGTPSLRPVHKPADGYMLKVGGRVQLGPVGVFADVSKQQFRSGEGGLVIDSDPWPTNTRVQSIAFGASLRL